MVQSVIYQIRNILNNKIYIGSSVLFEKRKINHLNCLRKNKHVNIILQNSWNKYGEENFIFEILEEVFDKNILIEREQSYLDKLQPEFNICQKAFSWFGNKHTDKTKKKMSDKRIGKTLSEETKTRMSISRIGDKNPNYGNKNNNIKPEKLSFKGFSHSEESKNKLRESNIGKKQNNKRHRRFWLEKGYTLNEAIDIIKNKKYLNADFIF